jgi:hypothetical protein
VLPGRSAMKRNGTSDPTHDDETVMNGAPKMVFVGGLPAFEGIGIVSPDSIRTRHFADGWGVRVHASAEMT